LVIEVIPGGLCGQVMDHYSISNKKKRIVKG
jgi:hypothetical protein